MSGMRDLLKKSKTCLTLHNVRTWYEMSLFTTQETALARHSICDLQTLAARLKLYEQSASVGHKPPMSGNERRTKTPGRR